jgi:hypothetical protein
MTGESGGNAYGFMAPDRTFVRMSAAVRIDSIPAAPSTAGAHPKLGCPVLALLGRAAATELNRHRCHPTQTDIPPSFHPDCDPILGSGCNLCCTRDVQLLC